MTPWILREKPAIGVSHGSRSLMALCAMAGIPSITIADYEYADHRLAKFLGSAQNKWIMTPDVVPRIFSRKMGCRETTSCTIRHQGGCIHSVFRAQSVVERRSGSSACRHRGHHSAAGDRGALHNPRARNCWRKCSSCWEPIPGEGGFAAPHPKQEAELRQANRELFAAGRIIVPKHAVDGWI